MPGFIELRCKECGTRHGFYGEIKEMPSCPNCGYRPTQENLNQDQENFEQQKKKLLERPTDEETPN